MAARPRGPTEALADGYEQVVILVVWTPRPCGPMLGKRSCLEGQADGDEREMLCDS